MLNIQYNDDFDKQHHPITDADRDVIEQIQNHFGLSDETVWHYYVTIHGKIFQFQPSRLTLFRRFNGKTFHFLLKLPGFRWIERDEINLSFGMGLTCDLGRWYKNK